MSEHGMISVYYPYAQPNIDFVTVTPQPAEIVSKKLDSESGMKK